MLQYVNCQSVLAILLCILAMYLYWTTRLPKNFPPGPRSLPIIGSMYVFGTDPSKIHLIVDSLFKRYGAVVGLKFGSYPAVILSSLDVIREAFVKQSDIFSERPSRLLTIDKVYNKNGRICGLMFQENELAKKLRRFTLASFRMLGVGKKSIESKIQTECELICKELEKSQNQPFDTATLIHNAVSNIICSICFGARFEYEDPTFRNLMQSLDFVANHISLAHPVNFIPFLKWFPKGKVIEAADTAIRIKAFVGRQIERHRETFNAEQIRDFVDLYLENETKTAAEFTKDDLEELIFDLFTAGTGTTSVSLYWIILYMIHYPDVQTRCHEEVDRIIGTGRRPCLSDRQEMPYVTATIQEMQRIVNLVPLALPHSVKESTTLCGFSIPKDTLVMASLGSVHMDPEYWEKPEEFRPERWIGPDGTLEQKSAFMPFSVGPRMCIGDMLAKNELFLFFTTILQSFTCHMADPATPPSLEGHMGVILNPARYEVVMQHRPK